MIGSQYYVKGRINTINMGILECLVEHPQNTTYIIKNNQSLCQRRSYETGKSSLLSALTNAKPEIADFQFVTKQPIIGIMNYSNANIQIIEIVNRH